MSLVTLSHVCSHLQNASRARLGLTSVPSTNLILTLVLSLQTSGFLSSVVRGGPSPPAPSLLFNLPSQSPSTTNDDDDDAVAVDEPVTQANIASRRLWLGLKYWNNEPVLREMRMVSRPTQRIWLDRDAFAKIIRGKRAGYVDGLTRPGECLFVSTDRGVLEARECVERRVGGMVLCRVL